MSSHFTRAISRLLALACLFAVQVDAGPLEDGFSAYQRKDYRAAAVQWKSAASAGSAGAQYLLGTLYEQGQGVGPDPAQAENWYRQAATQGLADAQFRLGFLLVYGKGQRNEEEGVRWFERAAAQGHPHAMEKFAAAYALGKGRKKDYLQALVWLNLAIVRLREEPEAASDLQDAISNRKFVNMELSLAQQAEAVHQADEWTRRLPPLAKTQWTAPVGTVPAPENTFATVADLRGPATAAQGSKARQTYFAYLSSTASDLMRVGQVCIPPTMPIETVVKSAIEPFPGSSFDGAKAITFVRAMLKREFACDKMEYKYW